MAYGRPVSTDATWTALADPHRRAVLGALAERAHAVGELVERLGLSQPQASKHLRVLRDAGLVRVERRAQHRVYSVDPAPIVEIDAWLQPYRALWNDGLDRLGAHLDASAHADHDDRADHDGRADHVRSEGRADGIPDDGRARTTEDRAARPSTTTEGRAR